MKKLLILLACLVLSLMLVLPAMADVDVTATVDKTKTKTVTEDIDIDKDIDVNVDVNNILEKAAEAETIVNQSNTINYACENCAEKTSAIVDSINNNTGIMNVNQATGNMNNQANVVSIAVDVWPPEDGGNTNGNHGSSGFSHAQTSIEQDMVGNTVESINILWRDAFISGSINNNDGIVGVNQSPANINNQVNAVTIGLSLDGVVALAEADLGQFQVCGANSPTTCQYVMEYNTYKSATIGSSVSGNAGIVGVNQTSGNMTNQANIANLAVSIR